MTYNVNLPQPADKIRNFPADVTTNNWPRLQTVIAGDHVFNLTAQTNDGYHKIAHFVDQVGAFGDGTPAPIANVPQYYSKTNGTRQHLFCMPGSATSAQTQEQPISCAVVRASVNFDGTGAVGAQTLRNAFNVTSVVKTATGKYTVNFTVPMPSSAGVAQYYPQIIGSRSSAGDTVFAQVTSGAYNTNVTTTSLLIEFRNFQGSLVDVLMGSVIIISGGG